ncbi:hypothetical protein CYFUS_002397 [Cystobacter fuscus]|uniref:Uncharacterized protein n=1 Tax=Cystobacter fuscus TaxID=43 RepID=A0A250J0H0_9BACT|nr:hypothetical protein CYFUS_002397 [Cystobacter fuscus]
MSRQVVWTEDFERLLTALGFSRAHSVLGAAP